MYLFLPEKTSKVWAKPRAAGERNVIIDLPFSNTCDKRADTGKKKIKKKITAKDWRKRTHDLAVYKSIINTAVRERPAKKHKAYEYLKEKDWFGVTGGNIAISGKSLRYSQRGPPGTGGGGG